MINNIVLDSNAFFKSNKLVELVKDSNPYTTSQVMNELKDQKTKDLLQSFPFKIQIRQPSKQAIKFVKGFSVLTGDSSSLSDTDIGVIALSYDLIEKIGMKDKLNKQPKPFQLLAEEKDATTQSDSDYEEDEKIIEKTVQQTKPETLTEANKQIADNKNEEVKQQVVIQQNNTKQMAEKQQVQQTKEQIKEIKQKINQQTKTEKQQKIQQPESNTNEEDDGWIQVKPKKKKVVKTKQSSFNDWITPQNYNEKKSKGLLNIEEREISSIAQSDIPVWLITADFAMQNVAMQIGIPTKASDGHQIFSLKRYVQMCYACGKTLKQNLDKITTCPKCGYNTLSKVAYTIDQSGNLILHKKKNWQPNKQVFQWKQKKMQEQAKHGRNQRKKKTRNAFQ